MKKTFFLILLFITVGVSARSEVLFDRCVDGDTAWFKKGKISLKYRFLAIDTPETVHPFKKSNIHGKSVSDYTCSRLKESKKIEIEYDSKSTKTDKYGRELVWVYLDDELFQLELIKLGYAKIEYIYGKYMYLDVLYKAEEQAKENKIGIWSNKHIVTFEYKDNSSKIEVIEGAKIEPIEIKNIEGYEFLGWYLNDEKFDFNTSINSDIKLIAKYKKINMIKKITTLILIIIILYILEKKKIIKPKNRKKLEKRILKEF